MIRHQDIGRLHGKAIQKMIGDGKKEMHQQKGQPPGDSIQEAALLLRGG